MNNECEALKSRRITHVVSVLSADQRKLPSFIAGHRYLRVDDNEDAAQLLFSNFEPLVTFIDDAFAAGGRVFVHCGAGISRAPTVAIAYVVWKLRIRAADALRLVRDARKSVRPNPGFVKVLKEWEKIVLYRSVGAGEMGEASVRGDDRLPTDEDEN